MTQVRSLGAEVFGQMMDYPLTLTQILKRTAKMVAHGKVITKKPSGEIHRYSYGDFYKRTCRLGHVLSRLGVQRGDRIGTLAWNGYEHLELYFAIPCIGAIVHTLNLRLFSEQLEYVIQHAEDRVIFVDASLVPLLEKISSRLSAVQSFVVLNAPPQFTTSLTPVYHYEDLLLKEAEEFSWPELDERLAAGLCYTSGTTGNPKGALYSHRSQYLHTLSLFMTEALGLKANDTLMPVVPMFHANAWGFPYAAAMIGADLVFPGPHLKPADLAVLIQDCKVSLAAGVPTLWIGLFQELQSRKYDVSSLRGLVVGGAAFPRAMIEAFGLEMNIPVAHAWGMTELSPLGTCSGYMTSKNDLSGPERFDRKAKQGTPSVIIEMRIVNDQEIELPWDGKAMGELQVRGPAVISSYFQERDGETQFTHDGWFKTGDVATISPEGCLAITDRSKDLIKSGGEWISSVALENALMAHSKVLEATVIGTPNEKWSERPYALVVPQVGTMPSIEELHEALLTDFPKFWIPENIHFVTAIPKTSVGKFDKKAVRQQYAEGKLPSPRI